MDDKDLHWIRVWDIISAAAIFGLFPYSLVICTVTQVKEHFRCPIYLRGTDQIQHNQNTMLEMEMFHRCAVKDNNYLHDFHIS